MRGTLARPGRDRGNTTKVRVRVRGDWTTMARMLTLLGLRPLLLAAAILATPRALAQAGPYRPPPQPQPRLAITGMTGYQINSNVDVGAGELRIDDGESFGAAVTVPVRPGQKLELLWMYLPTQAELRSYTAAYGSTQKFDVGMNYFQIGGMQSIRRGRVEPFFGATVGAGWYATGTIKSVSGLKVANPADTWRFAFGLGLGADIFVAEKVALRLEARTLMPVYFGTTSFYAGTGGSGMAVSGGIPFIQGNFSAGLTFAP
jgi:hypothetical protein